MTPNASHQLPVHRTAGAPALYRKLPTWPVESKPHSSGPRDILTVLFKHKLKILVLLVLGAVAGPLVYFAAPIVLPHTYEARAYLMVKFGWEYMYGPELAFKGPSPSPYARNEVINSEIQILNSRDLKERMLTTVGVEKLYPDLAATVAKGKPLADAAVRRMERKDFSARAMPNSSVVELTLQGDRPDYLAEALNRMIDFYTVKRLDIFKDPKSIMFMEKKVSEYRQKLKSSEDQLEAYKQENQVYSLDEQRTLLLSRRATLESYLMDSQNRSKELERKLSSLENQLKLVAKIVPAGGAEKSDGPRAQLLSLQLKEQELLSKYKENNHLVVEVRKQIEAAKEYLAQGGFTAGGAVEQNQVYQEVQKEIIAAKAELSALEVTNSALKDQLVKLDKDIQQLDLNEKKFRELRRELGNHEQNYQVYLNKLEEARIFDEMDRQKMTSVSVIQPAVVPLKPKSQEWGLPVFFAIGALLGLVGGIGLAWVVEATNPSVSTPEMAERRLGLPVIATIPLKSC
jgi:uncharacterized protein involved in exopolysaccharide biosynthesis